VDLSGQRGGFFQRQLRLEQRQSTQRVGRQILLLGLMPLDNQHHLPFATVFIFFYPRQQFANGRAVNRLPGLG